MNAKPKLTKKQREMNEQILEKFRRKELVWQYSINGGPWRDGEPIEDGSGFWIDAPLNEDDTLDTRVLL